MASGPGRNLCFRALVTFALHALAHELAVAPDRLGLFAGAPLGRLFVRAAYLHFTVDALALHLLLQRAQGLIDVVVPNVYLQ